mmetsp:Transcript_10701/g.16001  ORF Transcript_10701/g.16001 Transcript_10701/m.16001 type:complete len:94 (-) Transcript_10701:25-306(-)
MDLNALSEREKLELMEYLDNIQVHDSNRNFCEIVNQCFEKCSYKFKTKNIENKEALCLQNCAAKFTKFNIRMNHRFEEYQRERHSEITEQTKT